MRAIQINELFDRSKSLLPFSKVKRQQSEESVNYEYIFNIENDLNLEIGVNVYKPTVGMARMESLLQENELDMLEIYQDSLVLDIHFNQLLSRDESMLKQLKNKLFGYANKKDMPYYYFSSPGLDRNNALINMSSVYVAVKDVIKRQINFENIIITYKYINYDDSYNTKMQKFMIEYLKSKANVIGYINKGNINIISIENIK